MAKQVYECIEVDVNTRECTNWQVVDSQILQQPLLSKDNVNELTIAILSFIAVVFIYLQLKQTVKEMMK